MNIGSVIKKYRKEAGYEKTYQRAVNIINKYPNCNMLICQIAVMIDSRRIMGKTVSRK